MKEQSEIKDNGNSTKTTLIYESFPLLRLPKEKNEFFCLYFNTEENSIKIYFSFGKTFEEFELFNFPIEKCQDCQTKLSNDNAYYIKEETPIKFFCSNCVKKKTEINFSKLSSGNSSEYKGQNIVMDLKAYLKNNSKNIPAKYAKQMEDLINITNNLLSHLNIMNSNELTIQKGVLSTFIDNFSFYLEEISKIEMNYVYLFIKNIFIVAVSNYDKLWFVNNFISFFDANTNFNVPYIRTIILKRISKNTFNKDFNESSNCINLYNESSLNYLCKNFFNEYLFKDEKNSETLTFFLGVEIYNMKSQLNDAIINSLIKEIKLIKENINKTIYNYYNSFISISFKKGIERKIINSIIYLIFKHNYDLFEQVKENDKIINIISNDLSKIKNYLKKKTNKTARRLEIKIDREIQYYENKKASKNVIGATDKDIKNNQSKNQNVKVEHNKTNVKNNKSFSGSIITQEINKPIINLTDDEKKLLLFPHLTIN